MDLLIIVLIASGLFVLGIFSPKFWSLFKVWQKASKHGLKLSLRELYSFTQFYEIEDSFLKACVQFKKMDPTIPVDEIVRHHMADGDTWQLLDKLSFINKHGFDFSFKTAVLLDLSGKDIIEVVEKQNEVFELEVKGKSEEGFKYLYHCQFKIAEKSMGWINPDLENIKWQLEQKINTFLKKEALLNSNSIIQDLLDGHLNAAYWDKLCHGVIVTHDFKLIGT